MNHRRVVLRKMLSVRTVIGLVALAFVVGAGGCGDTHRPDGDVLATAGDLHLTVDEAAQLLASAEDLPNSPEVVTALGELWMDYTLLGVALVRDPTLGQIELGPLMSQQLDQELVFRLRDEVIQADTAISEDDLRQAFEEDGPGEEVRARHILLGISEGADPAERERTREAAESLRQRIMGGESFASLAQEHSDDPGSAQDGGDLGFFGRGMMVPPFEEAAFSLEPGEISEIVESPFGLHIIRVEERRTPDFEDVRGELEEELRMTRLMRAESIYVAELEEPANIQVADDAFDVVRELAERPDSRLSGRAARQALATYETGSFTAADFRGFVAGQPEGILEQIAAAPDAQLEAMLRNLTRVQLLKAEAERLGLTVPDEERQQIRSELVQNYIEAAQLLGLDQIEVRDGESDREAVARSVRELMEGILAGERNVIPMAELSVPLRRQFGAEMREESISDVVARLAEIRGNAGAPGAAPGDIVPPPGSGVPEEAPAPEVPEGS